jgi:hypothetical protein
MDPDADLVDWWLDGPYACGLFIGESGVIAAHTGIPVVNQFRPADHAVGGTGAPMMQYLDWVLFRDLGRPIATLNIGGIANCHLASRDRADMRAFDTGPGNVMIDHSMRRLWVSSSGPPTWSGHSRSPKRRSWFPRTPGMADPSLLLLTSTQHAGPLPDDRRSHD